MDVYLADGWLRAYAGDREVARCRVVESESLVQAGSLSVDPGAPHGAFLRMCREVLRLAGERKVRIVVDRGPDMERLAGVYARLGGTVTGIVMEN